MRKFYMLARFPDDFIPETSYFAAQPESNLCSVASSAAGGRIEYRTVSDLARDGVTIHTVTQAEMPLMVFHRRAGARAALKALRTVMMPKVLGDTRVVEYGTIEKEVRPVKHWRVLSRHRPKDKSAGWSEFTQIDSSDLRKGARDIIATMKAADMANRDNIRNLYQYRAVPVYADGDA